MQQFCARAYALVRFLTPNMSQHVATCRNTSQQGGQTRVTCYAQQCGDRLRSNVAIVWSELANAEPAMLGYVVLKCCDCLAGALGLSPSVITILALPPSAVS